VVRLHVIFYGQEDGVLASQLLLLRPGRYRLAMRVTGDAAHARSLAWTVTCAGSKTALLSLSLADPGRAAAGGMFEVRPDCPAQNLQLAASSPELPQQVEVTVAGLSLTKEQSGG